MSVALKICKAALVSTVAPSLSIPMELWKWLDCLACRPSDNGLSTNQVTGFYCCSIRFKFCPMYAHLLTKQSKWDSPVTRAFQEIVLEQFLKSE
ncbi:hypothetical protein [Exiguobacterium acetylicum]|uniref:hypothetical protein n=1 Tax=Exiguobacterium acetylicum TaxID=41170 RepID=UPI0034D6D671